MRQTWFITAPHGGWARALARAALEAGDLVAATARHPAQSRTSSPNTVSASTPSAWMSPTPSRAAQRCRSPPSLWPIGRRRQQRGLRQRLTHRDQRGRGLPRHSRPTSGASTTSPRQRSRSCGSKGAASSCRSRRGGDASAAHPGSRRTRRQVCDRRLQQVLRAETAPFGVKVMVVEPSGFRTDWAGSSMTVHDIPEAYSPTVGAMNSRVRQSTDAPQATRRERQRSRPGRQAPYIPDHLPLG